MVEAVEIISREIERIDEQIHELQRTQGYLYDVMVELRNEGDS